MKQPTSTPRAILLWKHHGKTAACPTSTSRCAAACTSFSNLMRKSRNQAGLVKRKQEAGNQMQQECVAAITHFLRPAQWQRGDSREPQHYEPGEFCHPESLYCPAGPPVINPWFARLGKACTRHDMCLMLVLIRGICCGTAFFSKRRH
jgi:hypothetical protein